MSDFAIEVNNLSKYYGSRLALNNLSFNIKKGSLTGLLGENGAGKSTTMNLLTGYLSASNGNVIINGINLLDDDLEAKKQIGYLSESPSLYLDMSVNEYFEFVCSLKKVSSHLVKSEKERIYAKLDLTDVAARLIGNLSKGYKQRVGLASALIGNPPILILDEPTNGLDPVQIISMRNLIIDLKKDHTIILSSHILKELEDICDDTIILHKGNLIAHDSFKNLTRSLSQVLHIKIKTEQSPIIEKELNTLNNIKSYTITKSDENGLDLIRIESLETTDLRETIFSLFLKNNITAYLFNVIEPSLEDIFISLTNKEKRG